MACMETKKREAKIKEKEKKEEGQDEKKVKKTKAGAIIREVNEADWIHTAYQGEGGKKNKVFKCKRCGVDGIRRDNRKVHACLRK